MALWSTGSIATHVTNLIGPSNIPTSISGTTLLDVVVQQINYAKLFTTDDIIENAILAKYQPSIIDFTMAKVLLAIDAQAGGISSVKLGDISVKKGSTSNTEIAKQLKEGAEKRLKELQRKTRIKRVIGC